MSEFWGLEPAVARAFYGRFQQLKPMQQQVIEPLLAGDDLILSAATGSGKTEAVIAPVISRYWSKLVASPALFLLYIVPTRALAHDLAKRLRPSCESLSLKLGIRHGEHNDLPRQPHILITTPESLDVMLLHQPQKLKQIKAVIIDEAHLFYNTQRGLQLAILLNRLQIPDSPIQRVALSGTLTDPNGLRYFLFGWASPAKHQVFSLQRQIDAQIRYVASDSEFVALILRLATGRPTKLLVFATSRQQCDTLAQLLQKEPLLRTWVWSHHSSLSPEVRRQVEQRFSAARIGICIATSTLELGIDIGDIDAVVLWEPPDNTAAFLQKIGRSNRRQHKTNVIALVPASQLFKQVTQALTFCALLDNAQNGQLPLQEPQQLYGALVQQVCSVLASQKGQFISLQQWLQYFEPVDGLTRESLTSILDELVHAGVLQRHEWKNSYGAQDGLWELLDRRQIYSNFTEDIKQVDIWHGSWVVGNIPSSNLRYLEAGHQIRFGGKLWQIQSIKLDGIHVQKGNPHGEIYNIRYPSRVGNLDPWLLKQIWSKLSSSQFDGWLQPVLVQQINVIQQAWGDALAHHHLPCKIDVDEDSGQISYTYYTFAGYWLNRAIALWYKQTDFIADVFWLRTSQPIAWSLLPDTLIGLGDVYLELFEFLPDRSYFQCLLPYELQLHEFIAHYFSDPALAEILLRLKGSEIISYPMS